MHPYFQMTDYWACSQVGIDKLLPGKQVQTLQNSFVDWMKKWKTKHGISHCRFLFYIWYRKVMALRGYIFSEYFKRIKDALERLWSESTQILKVKVLNAPWIKLRNALALAQALMSLLSGFKDLFSMNRYFSIMMFFCIYYFL